MDRQALGTARVIRANARALPLADNTVDLIVTSPPYFALRSYQDGGEHYAGQIGDEPTPAEFIESLLEVTRECVRVLKPSGSLWVNLGDKYATRSAGLAKSDGQVGSQQGAREANPRRPPAYPVARGGHRPGALRDKSLIGIPWRYALACIDELGLILRAEVVWSKPNGLPESVTDRVRRSHEQWFHFTIEPRYFSAVDEIREERKPGQSPSALSFAREGRATAPGQSCAPHRVGRKDQGINPLGKLPGSVWTVATEPLKVPANLGVDHFAAFPTEWPKRIIQGWSPAAVCTACGEGRRPVPEVLSTGGTAKRAHRHLPGYSDPAGVGRRDVRYEITGYACACPDATAPSTPGVVLDPFGGTGTTAMVAKALGRHGISVDMSADYCRLAEWRTNDRDQLAKVLGVAKVEQQPADQLSIFDLDGESA